MTPDRPPSARRNCGRARELRSSSSPDDLTRCAKGIGADSPDDQGAAPRADRSTRPRGISQHRGPRPQGLVHETFVRSGGDPRKSREQPGFRFPASSSLRFAPLREHSFFSLREVLFLAPLRELSFYVTLREIFFSPPGVTQKKNFFAQRRKGAKKRREICIHVSAPSNLGYRVFCASNRVHTGTLQPSKGPDMTQTFTIRDR